MKGIKNSLGKLIGSLIMIAMIVAVVSVLAMFGGAFMKLFGFTYRSVGSILLFFMITGILAFPVELFVKAVPKVLFAHFRKITAFEAKVIFVVSDTLLSMALLSLVDHWMKTVSATPVSRWIVSLVMALLCMNDVTENKDR